MELNSFFKIRIEAVSCSDEIFVLIAAPIRNFPKQASFNVVGSDAEQADNPKPTVPAITNTKIFFLNFI
jgi:hypothetical protein